MTISRKNINKPAPRWFLKAKKAITIIQDAIILILLGLGYSDQSFLILICRVGISAILEAIQTLLSDENNGS